MTATYTFDVFSSLDGYGSYGPPGDWGGYWGKQGPELLAHRLSLYKGDHRMVFGATTFREFVFMLAASSDDSEVRDPGSRDEESAGDGGVVNAGRHSRLAGRNRRQR